MVVLIHIDAIRKDYINSLNTPFLDNLQKKGIYGDIIPTFGFEPDPAYWAGLYPDEAESGAQFCYDPENSPFKNLKYLPEFFDKLPQISQKIIRKSISEILKRGITSPVFGLPLIPFKIAHYFNLTFVERIDSDDYLGNKPTVFKLLKQCGKSYFIHSLPDFNVDAFSLLKRIENEFIEKFDFAFFMIGNLDRIGHKYGPDSIEIKNELKKVDEILAKIFDLLSKRFGEFDMIILGDHGMCEINNLFDIQKVLNNTNLKLGKEYLYFIDSTMARFWFFNQNAKNIVLDAIGLNYYGHFLTKEEIDKYHLNYINNRMGELFFIAEPGVLLFPNFYQKHKPVKGMHGYLPDTKDQQSSFIIHSKKIDTNKKFNEPVDMRRIFPTILKLLGLDVSQNLLLEPLF